MYQSWVEISKSAILHNLREYQKIVGKNIEVMPIVKSNAYGHGMVEIAKIISPKISWIGVASAGEALALRQAGIKNKILVVSYFSDQEIELCLRANISLPAYDLVAIKKISKQALRLKKIAKVHIKIDTGATRVGVRSDQAIKFIKEVIKLPGIKVEGMFSHFASSEDNEAYTNFQYQNFQKICDWFIQECKGDKPIFHFGCSSASLVHPDSRYNMIRLGVSLYGLWPDKQVEKLSSKKYPNFSLKPALQWKTKIIQVKKIAKGTKIGYGCTFTASKEMKIAVVAVGYWEGYDRKLSNQGVVMIKSKPCTVIGRICMNIMMVDVSKINGVKAGDVVILLGKGQTAEDIAEKIGTINYEVVTRINPLLKRVLVR